MSEQSRRLLAKLQQQKEDTEAIQGLWRSFGSGFTPPDFLQCSIWLNRHDFETVLYGLNAAAVHLNKKRQALENVEQPTTEQELEAKWTRTEMFKYASACMLRRRERGE